MDMLTLAVAKNYTDSQRLAYVEEANVIFPETSYDGYAHDESLGFYKAESSDASLRPALIQWNPDITATVGKGFPLVVEFDGVVYHTKAVRIPKGLTVGNVYLAATNQTDTGEPFCFLAKDTSTVCFSRIEGDSHTLKILDGEDVIHPIDPKFLPDIGGKTDIYTVLTDSFEQMDVDDTISDAVKNGSAHITITSSEYHDVFLGITESLKSGRSVSVILDMAYQNFQANCCVTAYSDTFAHGSFAFRHTASAGDYYVQVWFTISDGKIDIHVTAVSLA